MPLKQTNLEGKIQEQGLSAPQSLLFPLNICGRQQVLGEEKQERRQVYSSAGHIVALMLASCIAWDVLGYGICSCLSKSPEGTFLLLLFLKSLLEPFFGQPCLHTLPWWCIAQCSRMAL